MPYVVRAVPQKLTWAWVMRWLPFQVSGTDDAVEGLIHLNVNHSITGKNNYELS
jgi:hypothetical protein